MGPWYFVSAAQSCAIDTTPRMRFRRHSSCWRDGLIRSDIPRPSPVGCAGSLAGSPATLAPRNAGVGGMSSGWLVWPIQVYGDAAVETGIGVGHYDQAKPPWIAARGHITERFTRTWIKR